MSQNQNLDATWQYHSGTKHSYVGLRTNPHSLDWNNKPLLFKIYPTLEVTRLPRDFRETAVPALSPQLRRRNLLPRKRLSPIWKLWRSCCSSPPASRAARNTSKEKFSFAQRRVPARSTKSSFT